MPPPSRTIEAEAALAPKKRMPAGHDEEKDGEERPEPKRWRARACIIAATVGVVAVVAEAPSWEEGGEG